VAEPAPSDPELSAVVVHWHAEERLEELLRAWPAGDPRFELLVLDNGSADGLGPLLARFPAVRVLRPGGNLGFAGGIAHALPVTRGAAVLVLNPDAAPCKRALEELLQALAVHERAAGIVPRLVGPAGEEQCRWQLRPLPSLAQLLAQALFLDTPRGPERPPEAGVQVEQPAAAALLLRRSALQAIGGLDAAFFPAYFEDVDLARRLNDRGLRLVYWPRACFRHALGSALPRLGYDVFLWLYYRNLVRYLEKHHGRVAAITARSLLALCAPLRLLLLPLRRPRRARRRRDAARGLLCLFVGAWSGFRRPRLLARAWAPPA
jgi:GT2 family glycosyltransferase